MTAEEIARVVADLRVGRVRHVIDDDAVNGIALKHAASPTVVDVTPIYASLVAKDDPVWVYEDHPNIAPAWEDAAFCYVKEHGNVVVMQATAEDIPKAERRKSRDTAQPVDWDRVRWDVTTFVWLGGRSKDTGPFPTAGPVHLWRSLVYEDGQPADLGWVHLFPKRPLEEWDMAHLVLLGSLNFLACRNVHLVEPPRPRAQRRRLERLGVSVKTINITPAGKTTRRDRDDEAGNVGVPLTSVRGHFAEYGVNDKGLLFGKYTGRFWIPQHARGSREYGESSHDYRLTPE